MAIDLFSAILILVGILIISKKFNPKIFNIRNPQGLINLILLILAIMLIITGLQGLFR